MATRRGTGTYLLVKETTPTAETSAAVSLIPDTLPTPSERLRVRRTPIALIAGALDERLEVWLDPHGQASLKTYDAANALLERIETGLVLVASLGTAAEQRALTLQLAAALAASVRTVLLDLTGGGEPFERLLGLPAREGLGQLLRHRALDPTCPIDVLGIAQGLDILGRGVGHLALADERLWRVVADIQQYTQLVLIAGPTVDSSEFSALAARVDLVVLLGTHAQHERSGSHLAACKDRPIAFIATQAEAP